MDGSMRLDTGSSVPVLHLVGEYDVSTVPDLQGLLETARSVSPCVILDLSGVTYLDSSLIGLLLHFDRELARSNGAMVIASCGDRVLRILGIAGVTTILTFFDSLGEALAYAEQVCAAETSLH